MFADPRRIAILVKWHEWRLSTDPTSESEMLDMEPNEPAKRFKIKGKAWTFYREWECALFDDARKMADFVVETDIKSKIPASLEISYLVVMFNGHISSANVAYAHMIGYLQSSKQLTLCALRRWFPEEEGIDLSVVEGGLYGNIRHEKGVSVDDIRCHRRNSSEQLGQATGNIQTSAPCSKYLDRNFVFTDKLPCCTQFSLIFLF